MPSFLYVEDDTIKGTTTFESVGYYRVTIQALDSLGAKTNVVFTITVSSVTVEEEDMQDQEISELDDRVNVLEDNSPYNIWIGAGNSGTESDFLASLVGAKGDKGDPGDDFNGDARLTALETGDTNIGNAITTLTGLLTTLQSEFDALETKTQNFGRIRILTKYGNLYEQKEDGSWEDVHVPSLVFSNDTINYWKNSYWHWNKGWRYIPSTDPYGEL